MRLPSESSSSRFFTIGQVESTRSMMARSHSAVQGSDQVQKMRML